ncbi:hypothetical protein ACFSUS_15140 [Spirosoma soli]|uniref:Secreted protein n=1 Tax=Spirosoma soli TaxID=1770529 RepID=A0ABW5M4R4_9BACT
MRLVQLILALYVVVLSALPCEALCLGEEPTPAADQSPGPVSDDCADQEWCSPFCLCATCSGFTIPRSHPFSAVIPPDQLITVALLPCYQAPHALYVPDRIWQPPRLS